VFMMGMYWCARSPETERIKILGLRGGSWFASAAAESSGGAIVVEGVVRARLCLLM